MARFNKKTLAGTAAAGLLVVTYGLMRWVVYPTFYSYSNLGSLLAKFPIATYLLAGLLWLTLWLIFLQVLYGRFSRIFLYLMLSTYLFLLFIVLFAKTSGYHAYSFNPVDFLQWDYKDLSQAVLNIVFFIPLGVIYGFGTNRREYLAVALVTLLGIETLQYVFYVGVFAVSDILLNFVGTTLGWFLAKYLVRGRFVTGPQKTTLQVSSEEKKPPIKATQSKAPTTRVSVHH